MDSPVRGLHFAQENLVYFVVVLDGASGEKLIYDTVLKSMAVCSIKKCTGRIFDLPNPLYSSSFFSLPFCELGLELTCFLCFISFYELTLCL